jgi:hypothetical protein
MPRILLVKAWTNKKSSTVGLITIFLVLIWPAVPLRSLNLWFETLLNLFPNVILYPILSFLVGSYVAIYFYNKKVEQCCPIVYVKTGASASIIGVLFGTCPACIPIIAFFLPLGIALTLSSISWFFAAVAIGVLIFIIYKMNGFKKF